MKAVSKRVGVGTAPGCDLGCDVFVQRNLV